MKLSEILESRFYTRDIPYCDLEAMLEKIIDTGLPSPLTSPEVGYKVKGIEVEKTLEGG